LDFSPKKNPIEAKQNWMIQTKKRCKIEHFAEPESEQNLEKYMDINGMDLNYVCRNLQ